MFTRDTMPIVVLPLSEDDYRIAFNDSLRVCAIIFIQALLEAASRNEFSVFFSELLMQSMLGSVLGVMFYHLVVVNAIRAIRPTL